tara:strand:+ start:33 stop:638 length:606 start_codon:yes stop_codon:yes gene_type:complete
VPFDQASAGRRLVLDLREVMKEFTKEQKKEVDKVLREIGQEEAKNMRSRIKKGDNASMGAKVAATISSKLYERRGDYRELEVGSIRGQAIGSRGADLAVILAEGKKRGSPVRDNPERAVWFFGNSPSTQKTFNFPVEPGYVSPAQKPDKRFIEQGMVNVERKVRERVIEGIIEGWQNTARKINRKSGLQDFQKYISRVRVR